MPPPVVFIVLDYPRLSETFVAQEILALERRGLEILVVPLRRPPERIVQQVSGEIGAKVLYLPKFPHREPLRVWRAWRAARRLPGYRAARAMFWRDLRRERSPDRILRFLQSLVLAHELDVRFAWLHAHFLYYPATVARYTSVLRGLPWSCSAHARDIWTTPEWEKREKLADCRWVVTCTAVNQEHLAGLAPPGHVSLAYHGLDLQRFPPPSAVAGPADGSRLEAPVEILSVGRAVEKKGYADLLRALAALPPGLHWRLVHIGGGMLLGRVKRLARRLGIGGRVTWMGPQPQEVVLEHYRRAHLFALACRVASDGDRDGLPNVLLEALSQRLPVVATRMSAIPELIEDGRSGLLVPPGDTNALSNALRALIADPALRTRMGKAGEREVRARFGMERGIATVTERFGLPGSAQTA
jgi:glycosyltransferase involved in cell wall biosynthesis